MEQFFSYGTLRSKEIQMKVFNRILNGTPDKLSGHKLKDLQIEEEFGIEDYHVAVASENPADTIKGVLFTISTEDLAKIDLFESNAYKRIQVTLSSGTVAWIYTENK
jgi:gamma-glutamylcyclotransferase (GGCT)/AIG2-like uncharacterized protein YtfP